MEKNSLADATRYGLAALIIFVIIDIILSLHTKASPWASVVVMVVIFVASLALIRFGMPMAIYLQAFGMLLILLTFISGFAQVWGTVAGYGVGMKLFATLLLLAGIAMQVFWARSAFWFRKEAGVYHKQGGKK
ncbi:hypothetical protein EQG49_10120 [Periweissella cryptocerci]|uniref:Uncharacterized protein n=1 Tax=Periweissella cryptocerci TaxID=2506420 RepID=A0A4P6YVJ1_9LACO|nr:hypothetical protein [Periweissella cryptocerci]QBO36791.1 hypothetical protein EQG49_10120 [Periweissella cryptocerci]